MKIDKKKRALLKNIGSLGLLGFSISNTACSHFLLNDDKKPDKYLIGNIGNTFHVINLTTHRKTKIDIGFLGHSFLQNPVNPYEILIPEKTSNSWCTVNILEGALVNRVYNSDFVFYGHFAFSSDHKYLFVPKFNKSMQKMNFDILDPKSYKIIESIPIPDINGFHDLHFNSETQSIVISSIGLLDSKNQKTNGIMVFDPIKNKVLQKIPTYTKSHYPTHLLQASAYEYLVSMEIPEGHEEHLGAKKDENGKYIIKSELRHFDIRSDAEATPLRFDEKFSSRLQGNIPYLGKSESLKVFYLGNPHTGTIFVLNKEDLSQVETLDIQSKGLAIHKDQLHVCSENAITQQNVVNAHLPSDPLLTSIHFNVVEV